MRKAYDTFLQCEVLADLVDKDRIEAYRYECACCGEEVRIAAIESNNMVSHFRHRSGNNHINCEDYVGQYGVIDINARSRKSKNERAEFYFDKGKKMFFLGLRFSAEEIIKYEQLSATFEFGTTEAQKESIYSIQISSRNFNSDEQNMIPIESFSCNYFLSNTFNNKKRKYEVFNDKTPTFFKLQNNDNDYRAKLVRNSVLYTNIPYFIVCQSRYRLPADSDMPRGIKVDVDSSFRFETMGRKFLGKVLIIEEKTSQIDSLLSSWGYQLETSEILTMLWPPVTISKEVALINSQYTYIYTTFEIRGNINVHSECIEKISYNITKVPVDSKIRIYKNNVELVIDKYVPNIDNMSKFEVIHISKETCNTYKVPDENQYFLFNHSGVLPLSRGMTVNLTPGSEIKKYSFGYYMGCVIPIMRDFKTGEYMLQDIISYYKRTEPFNKNEFDLIVLSRTATKYIEECVESGKINSAAKYFIKEGKI